LYVDDLLIASDDIDQTKWVKAQFSLKYSMKDLGLCQNFLGMEVNQDLEAGTVKLSLERNIQKLIAKFNLESDEQFPPSQYPHDPKAKLSKDMCPTRESDIRAMSLLPFKSLLGSLQYIADKCRHDILPAVGAVNQYAQNPGIEHWRALIQIARYLKHTAGLGLVLGLDTPSAPRLIAYADSNLADGKTQTRSRTGGVILYGNALVKAISHNQSTTATSTQQAEVYALDEVVKETMFFRDLAGEMCIHPYNGSTTHLDATVVYEDNQAAVSLSDHPGKAATKFLELKIAFVREQIEERKVKVVYISTDLNLADFFTKPIVGALFYRLREQLGFR
jgi:hypothetical protein